MIPIPDSVEVGRNIAEETKLMGAARTWLEQETRQPGIHASGLMDPLLAFWQAVDPKPIADRMVPIFLVGKVLHAFVLATMAGEQPDINVSDEGSKWSDDFSVWYSVDWDKGKIAEFKTSRAFREPTTIRAMDNYVEQTLIYMAIENRTEGEIWCLYTNVKNEQGRTEPIFRCYRVRCSAEDLGKIKAYLKGVRASLSLAIKQNDPHGLPICRDWKCGRTNCAYYDKCRPAGRFGTSEFDR